MIAIARECPMSFEPWAVRVGEQYVDYHDIIDGTRDVEVVTVGGAARPVDPYVWPGREYSIHSDRRNEPFWFLGDVAGGPMSKNEDAWITTPRGGTRRVRWIEVDVPP